MIEDCIQLFFCGGIIILNQSFLSKISSEEISMADLHSAMEKCVIIAETYGHLLSEKESCAFLSRKILDMSVLLRSWSGVVGEEAFFMVLDSRP